MGPYKDYCIICKAKLNDDGTSCVLDVPFTVYRQDVVYKGQRHYGYPLPAELDGEEVMAVVGVSALERTHWINGKEVAYTTDDQSTVESFKGVVLDYQNDERVKAHWSVTKAEAYATSAEASERGEGELVEVSGKVEEDGKEVIGQDAKTTVLYAGEDKDEIAPFCASSAVMTIEELDKASIKSAR